MVLNVAQLIFAGAASIATIAAFIVIMASNPVRGVLALVLCFICSAVIWMLAQAEFLSLVLVLVYVGAVMTLFLFVVMMLDIDIVASRTRFATYIPFGLAIVAVMVGLMLYVINPESYGLSQLASATIHPADYNSTAAIGEVLYTNYVLAFISAGVLLLIAIISAISLAHRKPRNCKTQNPVSQIQTRRDDRVTLVKMSAEKPQG